MILADENVNKKIIDSLRGIGIEVFSISESLSGIPDEEIISISKEKNAIIFTEDKDFGEWVFAHNEKEISVIFLRYKFHEVQKIINILMGLSDQHFVDYHGKFTTITTKKIRIRNIRQ